MDGPPPAGDSHEVYRQEAAAQRTRSPDTPEPATTERLDSTESDARYQTENRDRERDLHPARQELDGPRLDVRRQQSYRGSYPEESRK